MIIRCIVIWLARFYNDAATEHNHSQIMQIMEIFQNRHLGAHVRLAGKHKQDKANAEFELTGTELRS